MDPRRENPIPGWSPAADVTIGEPPRHCWDARLPRPIESPARVP
jgi:hypothetical protein